MRQWWGRIDWVAVGALATAAGVLVAVLALALAGGDGERAAVAPPATTPPDPPTGPTGPGPTGPTASGPTGPTGPGPTGPTGPRRPPERKTLEELEEEGRATVSLNAQVDTWRIAGARYPDAVAGSAYPGEGDFQAVTVVTDGEFTRLRFVAGIPSTSHCPQARAEVRVEDESKGDLWGPRRVAIRHPAREQKDGVDISGAIQVVLLHKSLEDSRSECRYGLAEVAWGAVVFE